MAVSHFKIVYFILSVLAIIVFSIIRIAVGYADGIFGISTSAQGIFCLHSCPFSLCRGFITARPSSWDKKIASPGAMDNLSGIGAALFMGKYYRENPDKLPDNCRVIIAALGSEEAGLKGSFEFTRRHRDDKDLLVNPIVLNIDSISDYDHFGVVSGDVWQMTNFDPELIKISLDTISIKDTGVQESRRRLRFHAVLQARHTDGYALRAESRAFDLLPYQE